MYTNVLSVFGANSHVFISRKEARVPRGNSWWKMWPDKIDSLKLDLVLISSYQRRMSSNFLVLLSVPYLTC